MSHRFGRVLAEQRNESFAETAEATVAHYDKVLIGAGAIALLKMAEDVANNAEDRRVFRVDRAFDVPIYGGGFEPDGVICGFCGGS